MRPDEWRRINNVAVKGMRMREDLLEVMDVYEAEHEHASPELKTAFDLLGFSLDTLEKVLTSGTPVAGEGRRQMNE